MTPSQALSAIPPELRDPLLAEYQSIVKNYLEHRWQPSELSGGRFCEIVYSILEGYPNKTYAKAPYKPKDFVAACRKLENNTCVPRSFQILIPRALPALYEVRNQRGVGHVGGDVDPNHMDATFVIATCNWVMAELVRVLHSLSTQQAQKVVDCLAERTIPIVWEGDNVRRVLDKTLSLREQILVLVGSSVVPVTVSELLEWTECTNKSYFRKLLKTMHSQRLLEVSKAERVTLLPPGSKTLADIVKLSS